MNRSTNYNLYLPETSDYRDVSQLTYNFSTLDTVVGDLSDDIGDVGKSGVWNPSSGDSLLSYIVNNVDRTHLPFSGIKVGEATVSDSPWSSSTREFTFMVYGHNQRLTVAVQQYGVADEGHVYYRSMWMDNWQSTGHWTCPTQS